jgi:hypothetical protein
VHSLAAVLGADADLLEAAVWLRYTEDPLLLLTADAGFAVGYDSPSRFSREYRRIAQPRRTYAPPDRPAAASLNTAEVRDLARRALTMTGVQHRHDLAECRWDVFPGTGSASEHDSSDSC